MGHRNPITQAGPDRKLKVSAALLPPPHGSSTGQHNPGELYNHRLERPARWGVWFRSVTTAFAEYRFKRLRHHRGRLIFFQPTAVDQASCSDPAGESKMLRQ